MQGRASPDFWGVCTGTDKHQRFLAMQHLLASCSGIAGIAQLAQQAFQSLPASRRKCYASSSSGITQPRASTWPGPECVTLGRAAHPAPPQAQLSPPHSPHGVEVIIRRHVVFIIAGQPQLVPVTLVDKVPELLWTQGLKQGTQRVTYVQPKMPKYGEIRELPLPGHSLP